MSNLVVSPDTAKKLKEAGFPQQSVFYWCSDLQEITFSKSCEPYRKATCGEHPNAPTAQELVDRLPGHIERDGVYFALNGFPSSIKSWFAYENSFVLTGEQARWWHDPDVPFYKRMGEGRTMTEALADLWLKLPPELRK